MRGKAWIFAALLALTVTPAHAQSWPKLAAICDHGGTRVTATPARELEPYKDWRVATADCGADIQARFYWHPGQGQIRVAFEYQKPSLWEDGAPRSYTAAVILDGVEVTREVITQQVPYTRWSWRLKEPKIIRDRRDLVAAGLLPPIGANIRGRQFGIHGTYKPLGLAGLSPAMGMAGGRQDFGVVTAAAGEYIATGNFDALRIMLDQADSLGSWPFVARDPKTRTPLRFDGDLIDASYQDKRFGERTIKVSYRQVEHRGKMVTQKPDQAHLPSFSYVPWMLTGDPYYLEGLQFEMVWVVGRSQNIGNAVFPRLVHNEQMRSLSWSIRTVIQAALGVPEDTPNWLVPKSYYDWISRGNAAAWTLFFVEGQRAQLRWGGGPEVGHYGQWSGMTERKQPHEILFRRWMVDFMALSLAHGVLGGRDEWRPMLDWQMNTAVEGGRYLRGLIATYSPSPRFPDGRLATSFAEMAKIHQDHITEYAARSGPPQRGYHYYWQYYHSVIRVAEHFGVPGAAELAAWLESQRRAFKHAGEFQFEFEFKSPPNVAAGLPLVEFLPPPPDHPVDIQSRLNAEKTNPQVQGQSGGHAGDRPAAETPTLKDLTSKGRELLKNSGDWIRQP